MRKFRTIFIAITLIFSLSTFGMLKSGGSAFASPDAPASSTSSERVEVLKVSSETIENAENSIPAARAVRAARSAPAASDPEHTENFTEQNGIRLMLSLDTDALDQATLTRFIAESQNELKFIVTWSDDINEYEFERVIRGSDLETLLAGTPISLGAFKTQPDGTGYDAPTYDFSVDIELNATVAKYINSTIFFDGTYILLPASEQTEWVKGKKSSEVGLIRVLPREVHTSLTSRSGSPFPSGLTGAFLRNDTSIMDSSKPTIALVDGTARVRFEDDEYQTGDETALRFVLTGDTGDRVVSVGDRQFRYTSAIDLYSGTTVTLVEKVQTVFRNPDGQSFGVIDTAGSETASTVDRVILSGFMGDALSIPRVTMKTDATSAQYLFVGFNPKPADQPVFDNTTEYVAQYKEKAKTVVPGPDGTVPNPEPGYMRVTFDAVSGKGYFGDTQNKTHMVYLDVYPGADKASVMAKVPEVHSETGFVYSGWTPEVPDTFDAHAQTAFSATYTESDAISPTPLPGYVKVEFIADPAEASLQLPEDADAAAKFTQDNGKFVVYVNPDKNIAFTTFIKPRVALQTGYVLAENPWTLVTPQNVARDEIKEDRVYKVATTRLPDSIPATDKDGNPLDKDGNVIPDGDTQTQPVQKPAGYVTISFDPTVEATMQDGHTKYYVNPHAGKTLENLPAPSLIAKNDEKMIGTPSWTLTTPAHVTTPEFKEDRTYTAHVVEKAKTVVPGPDGTVPNPEPGYMRVTFDAVSGKGYFGDTQNKTHMVYLDVYPGADKASVMAKVPEVHSETGFVYSGWTPEVPDIFGENSHTAFSAGYVTLPRITPVVPVDPDKPFNPEDIDDPNNSSKPPVGYVRIILTSGEGRFDVPSATGRVVTKIAFDIHPNTTYGELIVQLPGVLAPEGMRFVGWFPAFGADTDVVVPGVYEARYEKIPEPAAPAEKPRKKLPQSGEVTSPLWLVGGLGVVLLGAGTTVVWRSRKHKA